MSKYLKRLFLILAIVVGISWALEAVMLRNMGAFYEHKYSVIFKGQEAYDVLLLGSSRMKNMVNPRILDSIGGCNSFNAGSEGANIMELKMLLDGYLLAHPKPGLLVLNTDLFSLTIGRQYIGFYPKYLLYDDVPPVRDLLAKNGAHTTLYRLMPFLKTIELDDYDKGATLKVLLHQHSFPAGDFYYKGYESNGREVIQADVVARTEEKKIEPEARQAFEAMLSNCKSKGIRVVLVYAPEYHHNNQKGITNTAEILDYYTHTATTFGVPYLRNDSLALCNNAGLFANAGHLNRTGADIYTDTLARQLKALGYFR